MHAPIFTSIKVLESPVGVIVPVYPRKPVAIGTYDPSSVTTDPLKAVNRGAKTLVIGISLISSASSNISVIEIWDPVEQVVRWSANYDEQPNTDVIYPTGATPSFVHFGPRGCLFAHGIGIRTISTTGRIRIVYRDTIE